MTLATRLRATCTVLAIVMGGAQGQSTLGKIAGSVQDPSGAMVASASLRLRDLDENTITEAISSTEGLYQFLNVKPGRYTVMAEKPGFTAVSTPEIQLDARQTREADLTLQVAGRTEAVVVTAQVPLVDTEDGILSDSKNFQEITRLPLNYRASARNSPLVAILAVPGVTQDYNGRLSLSGGLPAQVEVSVDGISVVNVGGIAGNLPNYGMTPSPEIIGEFRTTSVDNSAEFGQMGDISMVTRGGSNQLHGSAFWYLQNRALDATIYGAPSKQAKVFNTFGGSLSGPVDLPSVYRGRDRTFFFVDYEAQRLPQSQLDQLMVPSASMRTGDLRGAPDGPAVDPLNGQPFPNNQIPLTRISSVATNLLTGYYPLPNVPSNGAYNYVHLTPVGTNTDGFDVRLDQIINSQQHLYARWTGKLATSLADNRLLPQDTTNLSYYNFVVSHAYTPRPSLSNEFRFGFTRTTNVGRLPFSGPDAVASLGLVGLNLTNVGNSGGFPQFIFADGFTPIGHRRPEDDNSRIFQYADSLSWIRGRHTMKFGAEFRNVGYHNTLHGGNGPDDYGAFRFSGAFSGGVFADFLLGLPSVSYYNALGPNIDESAKNAAFFAQDNWKIHPRLTLQLGLRWEVHPPFQEAHGNIANFDHQTGNVIIPDNSVRPSPSFLAAINACSVAQVQPCTSVFTASQAGLGPGLRRTYYGDWDPRFGFAWQPWPDGKTVVRGGIGRYTQSLLGGFAYGPTGIASSDIRTYQNYRGPGMPPLFTFPNVSPPLSAVGAFGIESFGPGVDPNFRDPYSFQWNFTIERELPWSAVFRASYIGVQSVGMPAIVDYNQVPASTNPFSQARTPFPLWASLSSLDALGFSNYQGMQLELSHRFQHDLFFQASYVLAKNLGEAGSPPPSFSPYAVFPTELAQLSITDRFDTHYDRGNLPGSRRNTFLLTGLFPLPFGQGREYGSNWRGFEQGALGGWELSTVTSIESGPYQTPVINVPPDQSNTGLGQVRYTPARPDRIGNGNLSNPTPQMYYDISAFVPTPQGAGRFGDSGVGILKGPGAVAIAGGLAKTFSLTEKLRLRIEATFTNLPNHPNFALPLVNVSQPGSFGKLTAVQPTQNSGNRSGQLAARLVF